MTTSTHLSEEQNKVVDESSLHRYRTEIPNIIFEMDLDTYEFKLYCILKKTAGDNGRCFKTNATLCKELQCEKPKLIASKNSLVTRGLITIAKRKAEDGGSLPDLITIVDIWPQNFKYMMEKYPPKAVGEGGNLRLLGGVIYDYQGGNRRLPKEEPLQEEPKKQQQPPPAGAANAAAIFDKYEERTETKNKSSIVKMYPILVDIDIPDSDKIEITIRYTEEIVINAVEWATHPDNPPEKCLAASIKFACNKELSPKDFDRKKKQTPYERVSQLFKAGEIYNGAECYLKPDVIAFERGMRNECVKLDKYFTWSKLEDLCASFGISIAKVNIS